MISDLYLEGATKWGRNFAAWDIGLQRVFGDAPPSSQEINK